MDQPLVVTIVLLVPFLGTVLGSSLVFFMRKEMNKKLEKILNGFAAGVMLAASIWSLILPSINMSGDMGNFAWVPAAFGFLLGIGFLLLLDSIIPHLHKDTEVPEGIKTGRMKKNTMLVLAVTLHNIPEGMAVGVVLAGCIYGSTVITVMGALTLAIGIAIQNFPEGAIISMPLAANGTTKKKAFLLGSLSGVVEPIFGGLAILLITFVTPILPYILSFAAGAMVYVIVEELIPEAQSGEHTNWVTVSLAIGFILMMVLDITLG